MAAGSGGLSLGSGTGSWTMPTGTGTWNGALGASATFAANGAGSVTLRSNGSTGAIMIRNDGNSGTISINANGTGATTSMYADAGMTMNVASGASVIFQNSGSTIAFVSASQLGLTAGINLGMAAGAGALNFGSATGNWTMPTGSGSWTGASNKTLTLTSAGISGNIAISAGGGGLLSLNSTYRVSLLYSSGERLRVDSDLTLRPLVTPPAGGSTSARVLFGDVAGFGIYYGTGAPTVSAAKGSLYLRSDGSTANDRMYVNTDGSTGWAAITTVS